ncbi:DUF4336 domain-containing protein [Synechococcus sp. RSCCF101]|uniref:DUF4336 domain-containing protein n=1 Tax=Synechococcus sp. RSCCF101 TaxID=2511069 RepID=UPI001246614D|nr:DUF4336 domain-containing protein [Synechococcus sp. RSCCF101]QEY31450.1 DUF4336 domain-containing protein [Synechococcus sp. RSCCF101]
MASDLSAANSVPAAEQQWPWWPLLPLYPYGRRRSLVRCLIPGQIWSVEQLQGVYYVAVPIRMSVVRIRHGLMLYAPVAPTREVRQAIAELEREHGPVRTIVLPTTSGLEHKLPLPPLARAFPEAEVWISPGQWSFPLPLPEAWQGIPRQRTRVLGEEGWPHPDELTWCDLGPLQLGLGRFHECSCLHRDSGALLLVDGLVGLEATPPQLFDLDPTPLLFHARERGEQPLQDGVEQRRRGWARLVLFANYLRPAPLDVRGAAGVLAGSFRRGVRRAEAHFGLYPFAWQEGWQIEAEALMGGDAPRLQVAPVLERLVFPRARRTYLRWLEELERLPGLRWLVPAHYSAPIACSSEMLAGFRQRLEGRTWAPSDGSWAFLAGLDQGLLNLGLVPKDPEPAG